MATQPPPDTIEPISPPETPAFPTPDETPERLPGEIQPPGPDIDNPGRGPDETPPPPD
ncbi:MAG: hypothetical protein ACK4GD_09000 [Sphingomonadaceae bacterium]